MVALNFKNDTGSDPRVVAEEHGWSKMELVFEKGGVNISGVHGALLKVCAKSTLALKMLIFLPVA